VSRLSRGSRRVLGRIVALAAAAFLVPAISSAQWMEFEDRREFFSVNFPANPVVTSVTYQPQRGMAMPGRLYTVRDGPRLYTVTVVNFATANVVDVPGAIAWEAWNFRKRGGEVTYDAYAQVDRIAGHQLHMVNPDKTQSFVGIYLHQRRLYILEARVPPDSPGAVHFQQSLQVLDETGTRIRYLISDDGTRGERDIGFDPVVCH
jgi:hypothetical protein